MKIPKKISPCPIVEAIVEMRFTSKVPSEAIFGLAYNALRTEYPKSNKLPISQLPEEIRTKDPNLKSKPHYQLRNENFIVQIGPEMFSLNTKKDYVGWSVYREKIGRVFSALIEQDIVETIRRLGIRYINFFDFNIYDKINLEILFNEARLESSLIYIKTEIRDEDFINVLQITNNASVQIGGATRQGSILDIDTVFQGRILPESIMVLLEEAHSKEKDLFYGLLKKEFLQTLNPEYD
jgi:uncharacterized protein (TIGR04255 family)